MQLHQLDKRLTSPRSEIGKRFFSVTPLNARYCMSKAVYIILDHVDTNFNIPVSKATKFCIIET